MSSGNELAVTNSDVRKAGRHLAAVFYGTAFAVVVMAVLPVLERYEAEVFPVVRDFRVLENVPRGDSVLISGDMRKVRDCNFVEVVFYVGSAQHEDLPREMLSVAFMDSASAKPTTREPGFQPWGQWRIGRPNTLAGPDIFMRVTHKCHWLSYTKGIYFIAKRAEFFGE